jgi:AcrR family transcriptional regulator
LERGFGATTLDQILELSRTSVGSFYHHFHSKVEVAAAFYFDTLETYQAAFLSELQRHKRPALESKARCVIMFGGPRTILKRRHI